MEPKKIRLTIELKGEWVLEHRHDEMLPVAVIKSELEKNDKLTIESSSLTMLTVLYDGQANDYSGIQGSVVKLFKTRYPDDAEEEVLTFWTVEITDEKKETEKEGKKEEKKEDEKVSDIDDDDDDDLDLFDDDDLFDDVDDDLFDKPLSDDKRTPDKEEKKMSVLDEIHALVGASEFKKLAEEISGIAEEIKRTNTQEVFVNQCYLFSIGDGSGLTTYLELMAKLIEECGLGDLSQTPVDEVRVLEYKENTDCFRDARYAITGGRDDKINVVCVDISDWMDRTNHRQFKQFLKLVEKMAHRHIVVFRVPFVEKDLLARIRLSLADLLSVKAVSFPPLSRDELRAYAEREFERLDFKMTKAAWEYFYERIAEEKGDGKFYGINTVKKVIRELIYQKHLANMGKTTKSKQITANEAKVLCLGDLDSNLSGAEQLEKLVGVDGIKDRVNEIIAQIELAIREGEKRPCIHMRFVGNPGTGKTTVARIIGKILKEKGILRIGAFFEYAGRDFCGRYIGETAPKTTGICRDAYGSVLFIDEAYSLYRGNGDTKDFGKEAIDTLIAEMENHRSDLLVIMAGYTEDMDTLMEGNLGLKSRMPYTIEFKNFTREQLYDIFVSMSTGKFKGEKAMYDAVHDFFINLPDSVLNSKDFSNARYVRNLFERTWAKAALRCQLDGKTNIVLTREDFEQASADKEFAVSNTPKKTRIGF